MKDYTTQHICNHNNVKLLISVIEVLNIHCLFHVLNTVDWPPSTPTKSNGTLKQNYKITLQVYIVKSYACNTIFVNCAVSNLFFILFSLISK